MNIYKVVKTILFSSIVFVFSWQLSFAQEVPYTGYTHTMNTSNVSLGVHDLTGAFEHSFSLELPSGRNGLTPDISLIYNSQRNDNFNIFGYGWDISIPSITRLKKKGVIGMFDQDYYVSSFDGELATTTSGTYYAEVDSGNMRKYDISNNVWIVQDKSGTLYTFGGITTARQSNPNDSSDVYKWMLSEIRDVNGNYVTFTYTKDDNQLYPDKITYTNDSSGEGPFEVLFSRENRSDILISNEAGFTATTTHRIDEIQVKVDGDIVKRYKFSYQVGVNGTRSLLSSITPYFREEGSTQELSLPATSFEYELDDSGWSSEDTSWTIPERFYSAVGTGDRGTRLVDINGDGLLDMVHYMFIGGESYEKIAYFNTGSGWESATWTIPDMDNAFRGARFADVNGDGLVDLIKGWANGESSENDVYINSGSGWVLDTSWGFPEYFETTNYELGTRLVDFNGDGLPDIVHYRFIGGESYEKSVYVNTGSGWVSTTDWSIPDMNNAFLGVRFIDVNGDGLVDLLKGYSKSGVNLRNVYLNNGQDGWDFSNNWTLPLHFEEGSGSDLGLRLLDINNDGLVDLVQAYTRYQSPYEEFYESFYINTGSGWSATTTYDFPTWFVKNSGDYGVRSADIDGDGLLDVVQSWNHNSNYQQKVWYKAGNKTDVLKKVNTSEGAKISTSYQTTHYIDGETSTTTNPELPFTLDVVKSITISDGFGNIATTAYSHEGGEYYFNNSHDRKFAGFGKVTIDENNERVTKEYYHQANGNATSTGEENDSYAKIGKKYRTEIYDGSSNLYKSELTKWKSDPLGNDRYLVTPERATTLDFDGDSDHKDIAEMYTYDTPTGNLVQSTKWGEVSANTTTGMFTDTGTDLASTTISYVASSTSNLSKPSREFTNNYSGSKVSETKYYYDALNYGNIGKGNPTKQENWVSDTTYIDTENTYNSYGLITQTKDPRNKATNYTYDSYNLYVATSTNPEGHTEIYEYDYSSGQIKKKRDANEYVFETTYDALDRPLFEKQPDLTTPTTLVTKTAYEYTDTQGQRKIKQTNYLDSTTNVVSYTYLDGFDRPIQTRTEAEDANKYVISDIKYDKFGRVEKESLPYFGTGSAKTTATSSTDLFGTFTYDPLDRVKTVANAVGTITNTYDQWKTTINDTEGNEKHLYKDAFGRLIQVDEENSASIYTTEYEYNALGNITKITDAEDNVRNFTYDGLGRRLTAQDLHDPTDSYYGSWSYAYDNAGNLTQTVGPKSQTVNYTYDDINRVNTEDYTGDTGIEVSYAYDSCMNGVGRLCSVTTTDAVTQYTYNPLGFVYTETKIIDSISYATEYEYDRQGNVTEIIYPDDSEASYTFNTAGLLESVGQKESGATSTQDIVSDFDYFPTGQIIYKEFGNGVHSIYTYDASELYRLENIFTEKPEVLSSVVNKPDLLPLEYINVSTVELFTEPQELEDKRSKNSKSYLIGKTKEGKDVFSTRFYPEPIHYKSEDGKQYEINTEFKDVAGKWKIENAPYKAEIQKVFGENFMTFKYKGLNVSLSPVGEFISAEGVVSSGAESAGKELLYSNALGNDISINVSAQDNALRKDVIIQNIDALGDLSNKEYYEIPFELETNGATTLTIDGKEVTGSITTSKEIVLTSPSGAQVYIWEPVAIDADNRPTSISIRYEVEKDAIYLTKLIPVSWLASSTYPIRTDATISYYAHEDGDGTVGYEDWFTTWDQVHDSSNGNYVEDSHGLLYVASTRANVYNIYDIARTFLPFDTSSLPDNATVSSASLNFRVYDIDPSGGLTTGLVQTTQSSTGGLSSGDYDECGSVDSPEEGASRISVTSTGWKSMTLNATGTNWISKTGYTKLGLRSNYDLDDEAPDESSNYRGYWIFSADIYGISYDPYLQITYTTSSNTAPSEPTNLLTEGQTNPTDVTDTTPEFSAIYNDADSGDIATDYQIQVTATSGNWINVVWNSTKTQLSGPTSEGTRTPDISYGGTPFELDGTTYYWRIKLWDDDDAEGLWSISTASFTMQDNGSGTTSTSTSPLSVNYIQDINYTYDNVGNITQIVNNSETSVRATTTYGYDDLYRLTNASTTFATTTPYSRTYTYNSTGNITNKSDVGSYLYQGDTGTLYANPHAVTSVAGETYTYDNNGNLTNDGQWIYTWNYQNRLIQATNGTTTTIYKYDHTGNRISYNNGSETTIYPNKYYNTDGSKETKHVYAVGSLATTVNADGTHFIHADHLTGSNAITNEDGDVEQTVDYYPYGDMRLNEKYGSFDEKHKFTGHEYDDDTSLTYAGARYYDGTIGRWLSIDPAARIIPTKFLGDPQQLNYYAYSRNNPLRFIDPFGLFNIDTGEVEKGDTLGQITGLLNQTYNMDYSIGQIAGLNNIDNPDLIYVGQTIKPNGTIPDVNYALDSANKSHGAQARGPVVTGATSAKSTPATKGMGSIEFANNFKERGDWDLKQQGGIFCQTSRCGGQVAENYIYRMQEISGDAPGNIHYGYVGKEAGYSLDTLLFFGGVVQAVTHPGQFSDPLSDKEYIIQGYRLQY